MSRVCRRILLQGRVQGVGFRWFLQEIAGRYGLDGWVRNRHDGSVEALVCGTPEATEAFIEWARRGPPHAGVERLDWRDEPPPDDIVPGSGFQRRPTAPVEKYS